MCYAAHAATVGRCMHVPDTDPSRRVVPVLSNRGDEPRRHPGLGGGGKRVCGVCRHHLLIEKGLVRPPPTLSLPFLRPPIPCWLGGCSSRVAYSKITAARIFLYSAPIGTCWCGSEPQVLIFDQGTEDACQHAHSLRLFGISFLPARPWAQSHSPSAQGLCPYFGTTQPGRLGALRCQHKAARARVAPPH